MIPWEELTKDQVGTCLFFKEVHKREPSCKNFQAVCRVCEKPINHDLRNRPMDLTLCFDCDLLDGQVEMGMV